MGVLPIDRRAPGSWARVNVALRDRCRRRGFVHHSDRGVQYTAGDYEERLVGAGSRISMSARGNPYDNAKAESFFKSLKKEEVRLKSYRTFEEAKVDIGRFIEHASM